MARRRSASRFPGGQAMRDCRRGGRMGAGSQGRSVAQGACRIARGGRRRSSEQAATGCRNSHGPSRLSGNRRQRGPDSHRNHLRPAGPPACVTGPCLHKRRRVYGATVPSTHCSPERTWKRGEEVTCPAGRSGLHGANGPHGRNGSNVMNGPNGPGNELNPKKNEKAANSRFLGQVHSVHSVHFVSLSIRPAPPPTKRKRV